MQLSFLPETLSDRNACLLTELGTDITIHVQEVVKDELYSINDSKLRHSLFWHRIWPLLRRHLEDRAKALKPMSITSSDKILMP